MRFFLFLALFLATGMIGLLGQDIRTIAAGTGQIVHFPDPFPQVAGVTASYDVGVERFYIYVPSGYNPADKSTKYGLIVFINQDAKDLTVPEGWAKVLDERKLFFIAPCNSGREVPIVRRLDLAILSAQAMKKYFPIDDARVFCGGVSGGAKMASVVAFDYPSIIHGTIQCNGTMYFKAVPRVAVTSADKAAHPEEYSYYPCTNYEKATHVRFVLITGTNDMRHNFIMDVYQGGFKADNYGSLFIDIPGAGVQICSGETLKTALDFIEAKAVPSD
jgi:hypothetical protein